jgi:CheY-like chemotaxis protein/anti-sigma regulatory factor (Ser/Thr protein kinase)
MLGQMASGIAHDISNTLSPAALYIESLLDDDEDLSGRARHCLAIVRRAIEDVACTVARIKQFYRRTDEPPVHVSVDVNRAIEQVVALTEARWKNMPIERGSVIRVQLDLASGSPAISGVESELREALTNLVLNAADAMVQGGTLTLRSRTVESSVEIEVEDSGGGMDEQTRSRCLEPFFTTKGECGTGLGLAMVCGMVERCSGEMEIQSEAGKGTLVRLRFPARNEEEPRVDPAGERKERTIAPERVLIVDDDLTVLGALRHILNQEGHMVETAHSGEVGISMYRAAMARAEPFSFVIADLGMPGMDGRQVAAAVKKLTPSVPVLLLTGWGHLMQGEHERPEGVDRVLGKPPELRNLRAAIAQLGRGGASVGVTD